MAFINGKQVLFSPQVNVTNVEGVDVEVVQETGTSETAVMSQKAASLSFANALKGNKSGGTVTLDDTSPAEHELGVTVRGVEDLSTVKVLVTGKNLLDVANAPMFGNLTIGAFGYERTETGVKINTLKDAFSGWGRLGYQVCPIEMVRGKTVTLSFNRTGKEQASSYYAILSAGDQELGSGYTHLSSISNNTDYKSLKGSNLSLGRGVITFTIPEDETRKYLFICLYIGSETDFTVGEVVEYSNVQVEISNAATEHAPYKVPEEYAVETDGTVHGITAKGETVTLYTDTAGATIACEYNRDINKAFAELQAALISMGGNV